MTHCCGHQSEDFSKDTRYVLSGNNQEDPSSPTLLGKLAVFSEQNDKVRLLTDGRGQQGVCGAAKQRVRPIAGPCGQKEPAPLGQHTFEEKIKYFRDNSNLVTNDGQHYVKKRRHGTAVCVRKVDALRHDDVISDDVGETSSTVDKLTKS